MKPSKKMWPKESFKKCSSPKTKWFKRPMFKAINVAPYKTKAKNPTCYKCGKRGQYNNNCRAQQKINELEIDKMF